MRNDKITIRTVKGKDTKTNEIVMVVTIDVRNSEGETIFNCDLDSHDFIKCIEEKKEVSIEIAVLSNELNYRYDKGK